MEFEAHEEKQIVACRAVNPKAFLSVEECTQCEFHKGIKEHAELNNKKYFAVICGLPTAVRIENLIIKGEKHGINI